MPLTKQQENIVNEILKDENSLVKVNAISGAGKTSTLIAIADALRPTRGQYMAYNKAIATEASTKFKNNIDCSTVHSVAYRETVRPFGLVVGGFLKARDIEFKIPYGTKVLIIDLLENFFLSKYHTIENFANDNGYDDHLNQAHIEIAKHMFHNMKNGDLECTHAAYLKLYHLMLVHKVLEPEMIDLLMLDEAGDVNEITLDIFRLLPAKKKVLVGDNNQNIYSFNNTINGFKELENEGKLMSLNKSFRVDAEIAKNVQTFCRQYLDAEMVFEGVEYTRRPTEPTYGFIARTNSSLIAKMIELNRSRMEYNLTRPAKQLFEVPMIMLSLKEGVTIKNPAYKFLESDIEDYFDSFAAQREFKSLYSYIANVHSDDIGIKSACNLIAEFGPREIITAFETAKKHEGKRFKHSITLTTAHSSKGLEWDNVTLAPDMNECLNKILDAIQENFGSRKASTEQVLLFLNKHQKSQEEFRLFYVAMTRARHELNGVDEHLGGF